MLSTQSMPDVAFSNSPRVGGTLDRVGMQNIELPIQLELEDKLTTTPARANLYVDLIDPESKGIHMSRLYKLANDIFPSKPFNYSLMEKVLDFNLNSQKGLSKIASIDLQLEILLQRPSLVSQHQGWRSYPIHISSTMTPSGFEHTLEIMITYSSTCPCSASLARQLIQENFKKSFRDRSNLDSNTIYEWLGREESICATPHSQRSTALIKVKENTGTQFNPLQIIHAAEEVIATPVQSIVKREDEQRFALLNGQNLMFCEDAARRLKHYLSNQNFLDFRCEIKHMESLHAHDAVAIVTKGIQGGFHA